MIDNKLLEARNPNKIWKVMGGRPGVNDEIIPPPISIEIQPTSSCNLRCKWCSYWDRNGFGKSPPKSLDFNILNDLSLYIEKHSATNLNTKSIYIAGGGEPCAYKYIREMVDIFHSKKLSLGLITNGTLFAKKLIDRANKFSYLQVSLIGVNLEDYNDSTRSNKGFTEMKNLPDEIKKVHGDKSPIIGGMYVITEWNYSEALEAIQFCKENNYDYCSFRVAIDFENRGVALNKKIVNELREKLGSKYDDYSNIYSVLNGALLNNYKPTECLNINYGLYCIIDPHGGVFLCIPDVSKDKFCIGNLYQSPFQEIWGGAKHRQIIQNLQNRYSCNECHYACRSHSYNAVYRDKKPLSLPKLHGEFI